MAWTPLTNLAHTRVWEHINNLATQLTTDFTAAVAAGRRTFDGTEVAIVGANPPAGTVVVEKFVTATGTVSGGSGGVSIGWTTPFAHGVCGVKFSIIDGAAILEPYPSGYDLAGMYWVAKSASGGIRPNGTVVKVSIEAWGW